MQIHLEELSWARRYTELTPFEGITADQRRLIRQRSQLLGRWYRQHRVLHCMIGAAVVLILLGADWFLLARLPRIWLGAIPDDSWAGILAVGLIIGSLHGWLTYSLVQYSLHEGAAHKMIFPPRGPLTRFLHFLSVNLCRLGGADPVEFAKNHRSHHAHFGTEEDGEFLNFVFPPRYWRSLIPFSMFFDFSDFITHRPTTYTAGRLFSGFVLSCYSLPYLYLTFVAGGAVFSFFTLVIVSSHVAFGLDRLRQFSEHNLMPIENENGARSFGPGGWGLLIGGGPWGQPCHWIHHMLPTLPWYHQIMLHRYVSRLLTPRQKRQFFLEPIVGYPKLLWRLWTEPYAFVRKSSEMPIGEVIAGGQQQSNEV